MNKGVLPLGASKMPVKAGVGNFSYKPFWAYKSLWACQVIIYKL
jgi:hypothetical protein